MNTEYIIGVDGGGTKTDYLLYTTEGDWVDSLHVSSRSHEALTGGFAEVEKLLLHDLSYLLIRNGISKGQITAAAFGMAGMDTPAQLTAMKEILNKTGIHKYVLANDSILGIKAGCPSGIGVCSINGTGTVTTGINEAGEILQVGGIGLATGDYAGGFYIASMAVKAVYDYYFRCGKATLLTDKLMKHFSINDSGELLNAISENFSTQRNQDKVIITELFAAANSGDEVAVRLVQEVADELAKSVSGCIRRLHFKCIPEIVLAGSIWAKSDCPLLINHFKSCIYGYTGMKVTPIFLKVIPAAGAIIWALELLGNKAVDLEQRETIFKNLEYMKQ
jgi:N-acetylglucosamine kinase-like BadF-type ATPase